MNQLILNFSPPWPDKSPMALCIRESVAEPLAATYHRG